MLELMRRELKFKLDDVEHKLTYPTVKQMAEYSAGYEESENKLECVINFLELLGLEKNIGNGLELDHLNIIITTLTEEKK